MSDDSRRHALWTLNVPDFFPLGPNQLIGKHKMFVANHRNLVRAAMFKALGQDEPPKFIGRPAVLVMRLWGKRKRALDPDNAMAAIKPIIDILRRNGYANGKRQGFGMFADDTSRHIRLLPVIQRKSEDGRTWTRIMVSGYLDSAVEIEQGPGAQIELDGQIHEALFTCQ